MMHDPDVSFDELSTTYEDNEGLRVPEVVHNSLLDRSEPV
jgi:hypothetical protein